MSLFAARGTAPQYLVHHRLGAGGMAVVHLGSMVTPAGERRVAIKQLLPQGQPHREATDRLIAEACLAFRLTHANICQVLDLAVSDAGAFIVMEHVPGLDLRTLLRGLRRTGVRLDVASAVFVACEVAQALDYAHRRTDERGAPLLLVHSDVTPQNILLSEEGEVKLGDFGVARALRALAPGNAIWGGTPGFIAPEALAGIVDQRADLFSLGVTLYAALGGRVSETEPIDVRALAAQRDDLPPELVDIVTRATAVRPEDRYLTASEMKQALAFFLARRFPGYTSTELAKQVRCYAPERHVVREEPAAQSLTLTSLRHEMELPHEASPTRSESAPTPRKTARLEKKSTRAGRVLWPTLATLFAIAVAVPVIHARRSPPQRSTEVAAPSPPSVEPRVTPVTPAVPPPQPSAPSAPGVLATAWPVAKAVTPTHHAHAASARTSSSGFLTVNSVPWGAVVVDGHRVADWTPAYRLPIAPGKHRVMVVATQGTGHSAPQDIVVEPGKTQIVGFHW